MVLHVQETKTSAGKRKLPMTKEVEDCFRVIVDDRNAANSTSKEGVVVDTYTHLGLEDATEELKRLAEFEQARKEQEKLNRNGDDDDGGIVVAIVANDASIKKQEMACNYFPSF